MTENNVVDMAESVGAQRAADGGWYFEDDEHLVEFALEIIQNERDWICDRLKVQIHDLVNG